MKSKYLLHLNDTIVDYTSIENLVNIVSTAIAIKDGNNHFVTKKLAENPEMINEIVDGENLFHLALKSNNDLATHTMLELQGKNLTKDTNGFYDEIINCIKNGDVLSLILLCEHCDKPEVYLNDSRLKSLLKSAFYHVRKAKNDAYINTDTISVSLDKFKIEKAKAIVSVLKAFKHKQAAFTQAITRCTTS